MQLSATQKKAIDHYYAELAAYHAHKVTHETAVRSAFQNLLAAFAQSASWTLIPEQTLANGKRPDGTLRDSFNLPRHITDKEDCFSPSDWFSSSHSNHCCRIVSDSSIWGSARYNEKS